MKTKYVIYENEMETDSTGTSIQWCSIEKWHFSNRRRANHWLKMNAQSLLANGWTLGEYMFNTLDDRHISTFKWHKGNEVGWKIYRNYHIVKES